MGRCARFALATLLLLGCGEELAEPPENLPPGVPTVTGSTEETPDAGPSTQPTAPTGPTGPTGPTDPPATPPPDPWGCPDIYHQDILPTFAIEIDPAEWAALEDEQANWEERVAAGLPEKPYHPLLAFRYGSEVIRDARIRIKGDSTRSSPKLQFQISFNEVDPDGRFHGLRKLTLDASIADWTFLRDRLALAYLRDLGVPASCANNARLVVNGAYYGLYANIEKVDREFLERVFGKTAADGDLFKYGVELQTNEETASGDRPGAWWDAPDLAALERAADLDQAIQEWAAEAVIPHGDGFWAGRGNYYLYAHPTRGFIVIPWDLDSSFDWVDLDADPLRYEASGKVKFAAYNLVTRDAAGLARYLAALGRAVDGYDVALLRARFTAWSAQIAQAADEDTHKPFSDAAHAEKLDDLEAHFAARHDFVRRWLACFQSGGADGDGDGVPWCRDCDEVTCAQ